jgi:hypothetical protein
MVNKIDIAPTYPKRPGEIAENATQIQIQRANLNKCKVK